MAGVEFFAHGWRLTPPALAAFCILISGCAGQAGSTTNASDDQFPQGPVVEITETTGGVLGVVTDESLAPLGDVEFVLGGGAVAISDADGRFGFSRQEPGEFDLSATKPGYLSFVRKVVVVANEVTQVRVQLASEGSPVPYFVTLLKAGHVGCHAGGRIGLSGVPNSTSVGCHAFGRVAPNTFPPDLDASISSFQIPLGNTSGFWGQTEWRSTQALGTSMAVAWYYPLEKGGLTFGTFRSASGGSPLSVRVPMELIQARLEKTPSKLCNLDHCVVEPNHYGSSEWPSGSSAAQIGFTFQQRFTDYITTFYNTALPSIFSALPDA